MLKNKNIIDNLTIGQKLSLLATTQISPQLGEIPSFKVASLEDINSGDSVVSFPSLKSLANSWDCDLISEISTVLATKAKKDNIDALVTPNLAVKTNVYSVGMSEDVFLSERLASAYANGISKAGVMPILSNCAISQKDAEYMDLNINKNIIRDYIAKPFETALKECGRGAVMTSCDKLKGNYQDVNLKTINEILHNKIFFKSFTVCGNTGGAMPASNLNLDNTFLLNSSVEALESAYNKFLQLKESFESAKITPEEYESMCASGVVLSDETLDCAIDRILDFALACKKLTVAPIKDSKTSDNLEKLSLKASSKSIVLLKNENSILPLKTYAKVAIVGQIANLNYSPSSQGFLEMLTAKKVKMPFEFAGFANGYDLNEERNDALIKEALTLTKSANIVLLFLGFNEDKTGWALKRGCLKLPANQLALVDALKKSDKKIIAIVSSEYAIDTNFDEDCSALILSPRAGTHSSEALLKIIRGEINPSGKLACTYYYNPDEYALDIKKRKNLNLIKIGSFFGYRSYDTCEVAEKYPFGYGLSYTTFFYSGISASARGVKFCVENTGNLAGYETAQVYIGKINSNIARPLKELKAFEKIYLEPGKSKTIKINFYDKNFTACDSMDFQRKVEDGEYKIYIASSASDIQLKKIISLSGEKFVGKKEHLSEYIQIKSNIVSGGYTLQTKDDKKSKRKDKIENAEVKENEVVLLDERDLEKLFVEEFAEKEDYEDDNKEIYNVQEDFSAFINKNLSIRTVAADFINFMSEHGIMITPSTTRNVFSAIYASRLLIFTSDNTTLIEEFVSTLSSYFGVSSFIDFVDDDFQSVDRLLFKHDENGNNIASPTASAIKAANGNKELIHFATLSGLKLPEMEKALSPILNYVSRPDKENKINICDKKLSDESFIIPPNLWFTLILSPNISFDKIPLNIAEKAILVNIPMRKTIARSNKNSYNQLNYHQFLKFGYDSLISLSLAENRLKAIDKLQDYISAIAPYKIGNKQWRMIEKFTSVYLAIGGAQGEALDNVVASKLLIEMAPLINLSSNSEEIDFSTALEKILGEENATECLKILKTFRLNNLNQTLKKRLGGLKNDATD